MSIMVSGTNKQMAVPSNSVQGPVSDTFLVFRCGPHVSHPANTDIRNYISIKTHVWVKYQNMSDFR